NTCDDQEKRHMNNYGLANLRASYEYEKIIASYIGEEALEEKNKNQNIIVHFINNLEPLMEGLWQTIWLSFVSFFIALIFGVIIGLMRTSDVSLLNILSLIYIVIIRCSPLFVLVFFFY